MVDKRSASQCNNVWNAEVEARAVISSSTEKEIFKQTILLLNVYMRLIALFSVVVFFFCCTNGQQTLHASGLELT